MKQLASLAVFMVVGLAAVAGAAHAEGPFGGSVTALLVGDGGAPEWAGTERGLFRYQDGRWRRVAFWGTRHVTALARAGGVLLASEHRHGLWISTDRGITWHRVQEGLQTPTGTRVREVLCLVTGSQEDDGAVYLGSAGQGLFESRDQGRTWKRLDRGLKGRAPQAFHVTAILPPEPPRPLLMGTEGAGLFSWHADGWRAVEGLPPGLRVRALAGEPGEPEHILMATRGHGLWESRDAGSTWKRVRKGLFGMAEAVAVARGGRWVAFFAGEGLVVSGSPRPRVLAMWKSARVSVLEPSGGGWLAGLAHDGVWRLSADGAPSGPENAGMDATTVLSLLQEPDGTFWGGDTNGVFRSVDGGENWMPRDRGLPGASVNVLLRAGESLYAGTGGRGVFRWDPEAGRWEDVSQGLGTANTIFSLAWDGTFLYAGTEGGILRCSPGKAWEAVSSGLPTAGRWIVAASGGTLWAAGGGSIFRSLDRGASWERAGSAEAVALLPGAGEGLWVLGPFRITVMGEEAFGPPRVPLERGEQFTSGAVDAGGVWLGTSQGLWRVSGGVVRRVWEGARVTALWAEAGGVRVGTDGRGVVAP